MAKIKTSVAKPTGGEDAELQASADKEALIYTYVGGGESSPHVINFMGLQQFVRGKATEVTDARVLAKIADNPTFCEGEIGPEELAEYDTAAGAKAELQRKKDKAINAAFNKKHAGE